jgi:SAM-dependent methyltransferase
MRVRRHAGDRVRCLCCGRSFARWMGDPERGRCPNCGSATRQKVLVHVLGQHAGAGEGRLRTLYFAPDPGPLRWLRAHPRIALTTADLSAPGVDAHWDITAVPQADASYDLIVCSHVLEHVPEDLRAMAELRRLLAPGGLLIVQVPYARDVAHTDEDPAVTDPEERRRRFGQFDHVRRYGRDLLARLAASGLEVETLTVADIFPPEDWPRLGLWNDCIFLCRPAPAG